MNSHLSFKHLRDLSNIENTDNQNDNSIDQVHPYEEHSSSFSSVNRFEFRSPHLETNKHNYHITQSSLQILKSPQIKLNNKVKQIINHSINISNFEKADKTLKESIIAISQLNKTKSTTLNNIVTIRNIMINWVKEGETGDADYNKFITEKKIKYLLKHKDKYKTKLKIIEFELNQHLTKLQETNKSLGDMYISYDYVELKEDIYRLENSYEVKTAKKDKIIQKLEEMKGKLLLVKLQNQLKFTIANKKIEKNSIEKNIHSTNSNLNSIVSYYKSLKTN